MVFRGFVLSLILVATSAMAWADEGAANQAPIAAEAQSANPDPWEGFNRVMYRFNDTMDRYVLRPVAVGYKKVTPTPVRTGISNFFINLRSPIVMLNDLLQGKVKQAGKDTTRFVVNSTIGLAGFVDVARRMDLPANDEDFGQTLGKWGMGSGPYLVLPFIGPSSVRDGIGLGVDSASHPRRYVLDSKVDWGLWAVDGINTRANLLDVEGIVQGDKYLFIRDLYLQRRAFLVNDGQVEDPFLDDDFDAEEESGDSGAVMESSEPEAKGATETAEEPSSDSASSGKDIVE